MSIKIYLIQVLFLARLVEFVLKISSDIGHIFLLKLYHFSTIKFFSTINKSMIFMILKKYF
jgi:hypothetical protein